MSMPRSIDVLKNDRKFLSVCSMFAKGNLRFFIFGARTIFFGFALICFRFKSRLYDGDSIGRLARSRCSKTNSIHVNASQSLCSKPGQSIRSQFPLHRSRARDAISISPPSPSLSSLSFLFLFSSLPLLSSLHYTPQGKKLNARQSRAEIL